jgi:hypothetical protein
MTTSISTELLAWVQENQRNVSQYIEGLIKREYDAYKGKNLDVIMEQIQRQVENRNKIELSIGELAILYEKVINNKKNMEDEEKKMKSKQLQCNIETAKPILENIRKVFKKADMKELETEMLKEFKKDPTLFTGENLRIWLDKIKAKEPQFILGFDIPAYLQMRAREGD